MIFNIKTITKAWLENNGYSALCGTYCGCEIKDLMPCGEPSPSCLAGYWRRCDDCGQWLAAINKIGPYSCEECMDKEINQ